MQLITLLLVICASFAITEALDQEFLQVGETKTITLDRGEAKNFCVKGTEHLTATAWFYRTSFIVISPDSDMDLNSVKGISTDDFAAHVRMAISYFFKDKALLPSKNSVPDLREADGALRKLLSACPSRFTSDKKMCDISLSTYGTACVIISKDSSTRQKFTLTAQKVFQWSLLSNFIVGILIIVVSKEIAKSKIFQYFSGSALCIALGLLFGFMYASSYLTKSSTAKYTGAIAAFTGYGLTMFWLLYDQLIDTLLSSPYLECFCAYIFIMGFIGFIFIYRMRSDEQEKSTFRFAVMSLIRTIGLLFVYNATGSPLASILTVLSAIVLMIFTSFDKIGHQE